MKNGALLAAACCLSLPTQALAESWLCIADLATGFKYNKTSKRWQQVQFDISDNKMIIKSRASASVKFSVSKFGDTSSIPEFVCNTDFTEYGYLLCDGLFGEFKFNRNNLRYIRTYLAGFVEVIPTNDQITEGDDTPLVEIGKCSAI